MPASRIQRGREEIPRPGRWYTLLDLSPPPSLGAFAASALGCPRALFAERDAPLIAAFKPARASACQAGAVCPLCGSQSSWPLSYNREDQFEQEHGARFHAA